MPHDRNNVPLAPGDIVVLRARVQSITQSETHCNVTIVPADDQLPQGAPPFQVAQINSRFFEKELSPYVSSETIEHIQRAGIPHK